MDAILLSDLVKLADALPTNRLNSTRLLEIANTGCDAEAMLSSSQLAAEISLSMKTLGAVLSHSSMT